jgi:lipid-binding SYLF domain-containing protein
MCGKLFCQKCSSQRSLIPPSSIVLLPPQSKKKSSFAPKEDAQLSILFRTVTSSKTDASSTATDSSTTTQRQQHHQQRPGMVRDTMMYYAKNLEERTKLAHEPLRVCDACYLHLQPFQEELRATNSNAVRFNTIDPTSCQRLLNSPLAFTLGHEIRKAAYTLNNWLPLPKRISVFTTTPYSSTPHQQQAQQQQQQLCTQISPNLSDIDGIRIPARLLSRARGIAVVTILKGGFGFGVEFGTGLVVARLDDVYSTAQHQPQWSAPSAIGIAGVSWGALIGAQVSDVILLLMTEESVRIFCNSGMSENGNGTVQLGADIGIAVGPIGRSLEGSLSIAPNHPISPIYTYSSSKGLYAGISLEGKMIFTRDHVNEKFYGMKVHPQSLLYGDVPTPPAAQPLYDALKRCRVYANTYYGGSSSGSISTSTRRILARNLSMSDDSF